MTPTLMLAAVLMMACCAGCGLLHVRAVDVGAAATGPPARVVQPEGETADFDVLLGDEETPSFRILLPEAISGEGLGARGGLHTVRGQWSTTDGLEGTVAPGGDMQFTVRLQPRPCEVAAWLTVKNTSAKPFANVRADICVGVTRLPAKQGWSNRAFILPSVPFDRDQQGCFWYREVTPKGLLAWTTDKGWVPMHARPDDPDPAKVPPYEFLRSKDDCTRACAVPSLDGGSLLFLIWSVPCQYQAPFRGNACMHLLPLVAGRLAPGESATIRGLVGVHRGSREELTGRIGAFSRE